MSNCILIYDDAGITYTYGTLNNCIIYVASGRENESFGSTDVTLFNNVTNSSNLFKYTNSNKTNKTADMTTLFKTFKGTYDDNENFELKDTAKKNYLGTDGKEVGIYGGSLPFDPVPSNPQITKCNVAAKSTADGKLSVDIEVNGAK